MAIAKLSLVALDCPDPLALAEFYQRIVGGVVRADPPDSMQEWVRLQIDGASDIGFQRNLDYQAPEWPHGAQQQAHLDLFVDDLDTSEREVVTLGARKASIQPSPTSWRVFLDPVGHPFCLVTT